MAANDFSRKELDATILLCAISILQYYCVNEEMIKQNHNKKSCEIIKQLKEDTSGLVKFVWNNDSLWY